MREFSGSVYKGSAGSFLAAYTPGRDIYVTPSLETKLKRLAHFAYTKKGSSGKAVDVFHLPDLGSPDYVYPGNIINLNKTFTQAKESSESEVIIEDYKAENPDLRDRKVTPNQIKKAWKTYDIQAEIKASLPQEMISQLKALASADIADFCKGKPANPAKLQGFKIDFVDEVIAKTLKKEVDYNERGMLDGGKPWYVEPCLLEANLDFNDGCKSSFIPGNGGGSFDGDFFRNYYVIKSAECVYCYSEWKHKSFPKTFKKFNPERLEAELLGEARIFFNSNEPLGRKVSALRLGKNNNSWSEFFHEEFMQTLEICAKHKIPLIIPTKYLPFMPEVADLLKRTNSTLLYSIGWDEFELGAVASGSTNAWRIEQARKYKEAGLEKTTIYHMILGHMPPTQRDLDILDFTHYGKFMQEQLLPVRFEKGEIAKIMCNQERDVLVDSNPQMYLGFVDLPERGTYVAEANNALVCKVFDPFWLDLVKDNHGRIRMCHHHDENVYCGGCFQSNGLIMKNNYWKQKIDTSKNSKNSKTPKILKK